MKHINIKNRIAIPAVLLVLIILVGLGCKQEFIHGHKLEHYNPETAHAIYFSQAKNENHLVSLLDDLSFSIDTSAHTASFAIPVYKSGFVNEDSLTFEVETDNSSVDALIQNSKLPANTVDLEKSDYTVSNENTIPDGEDLMKGKVVVTVKIPALNNYAGKTIAVGLRLSKPSNGAVVDSLSRIVLYGNVDDLLLALIPPKNLIDASGWTELNISNNNDVTVDINNNGALFYSGGGGFNQVGAYQAVDVKAGVDYDLDLHVKGSGMTDCWFEVWVGTKAPDQGQDYTDAYGSQILGLNTWSGCGGSSFDGELSKVGCIGSGGPVSFSSGGTVYIVIKCGGADLGNAGVTASDITFIRKK